MFCCFLCDAIPRFISLTITIILLFLSSSVHFEGQEKRQQGSMLMSEMSGKAKPIYLTAATWDPVDILIK